MKTILRITLTLLLLITSAHRSSAQIPTHLQQSLQDTLDILGQMYGYKGLSAAVHYKELGAWTGCYGISTPGVPLSSEMGIGLGSNTKTYVSALMLQLYEAGKIDLDDTIGTWVQGYPHIDGSTTVRQILSHTSGIANYTDNPDFLDSVFSDFSKVWDKQEILLHFVEPALFAPGSAWSYSNTNYLVAGLILEDILMSPIYQIIRDSILTPQGLSHTFFPPQETATTPYAHFWTDLDADGDLDDMGDWNAPNPTVSPNLQSLGDAAGSLVATAEDNALFWKSLMQYKIIDSVTIYTQMLDPMYNASFSIDYGLGIIRTMYLGRTYYYHDGLHIGQHCNNLADPETGIYISLLSNQDSLQTRETLKIIRALYIKCLQYDSLTSIVSVEESPYKIYPNPSSGHISIISAPDQSIKSITVYNILGSEIYTKKIQNQNTAKSLDLSSVASGLYWLLISDSKGREYRHPLMLE